MDSVLYAIPFQLFMRLPIDVGKPLGLGHIENSVREFSDSKFEGPTVKSLNLARDAYGTFPERDFHNISVVIRNVHTTCLYEVSTQRMPDCSVCCP
jgi:hypothetical protein